VMTKEPVWVESGWCEFPILRWSRGKVVLPNGAFVVDESGTIDGNYTQYHSEGPFKGLKSAEYPYISGRISGIVTFWDDHGKVVRQERWSTERPPNQGEVWMPTDADIAEARTSGPWWNGMNDQVPPDGVYTKTESSHLGGAGRQVSVFEQWRYSNGEIAEQRNSTPWLEPDPGFWKLNSGTIVFFPGAGEARYVLDGRRVVDRQELRLRNGPRVRVEFEDDGKSPEAWYVLLESNEGIPAGRRVELQRGAHLEW